MRSHPTETTKTNPRTGSVVYVKWHDAFAVAPSWISFDDIVDEPAIVESVGWLVSDCVLGHIVLAQSVLDDEGDHLVAIPVGMVCEMRTLFSNLVQ